MMDGFDLDSPLVCEGIIGDGCGGGRIFYIEGQKLLTYDPLTKEKLFLCDTFCDILKLTKSACILHMESKSGILKFDLSSMRTK